MRYPLLTLSFLFLFGCSAVSHQEAEESAGGGGQAAASSEGGASPGSGGAGATAENGEVGAEAPAFIATMTHLEGGWSYEGPQGEEKFAIDVSKIQRGMGIFSELGAVMTVESEIPFAEKAIATNSSIFTELLDAGFGVGTHCDITPTLDLSAEEMAVEFSARKAPMDTLIGAGNNLGCSGGGTRSDWVTAAHLAGFKYINGIVGFHYLPMGEEARPEGWTDDAIFKGGHYHDPSPVDLTHRMHPFMMADASDFEPDEDGVILANAGELGSLVNFSENELGEKCTKSCPLTTEDVDIAIDKIEQALSVRDAKRVFKVDVYMPLGLFVEKNRAVLSDFIGRVNSQFVETGRLTWGSQKDVYEAYVSRASTSSEG